VKVIDPNSPITPEDGMVVQVGRRKFAKIVVDTRAISASGG